ncbi:carbohydrate-binding protein [Cohnella thailandensis]|uniref:Carbohydrate-binding protein n=1 Tax=Cohnella thailandensis TaxID=557557 RepID=A0A841SQA0_9BACL|nr:carbohydrate-binding protein [Cohnella thailandensis]MBB6633372.1 carbohydrate-binding protein [Cohnella thailandensis]MBP1977285.1 hypothetical protein [Cohnella thailandensis]
MMKRSKWMSAFLGATLVLGLLPAETGHAANPQFLVDLSVNTGAIQHGASGFLYGLSDPGIPSDNMLIPLKPQSISQKAPDGLQHPNGDALVVAPQFIRAGGSQILIEMQDIYQNWPYENNGLADYLTKVDTIVNKVLADPNKSIYAFIPFNEPNWIWYNSTDKLQNFFNDWKTVYQRIRSIYPAAKIAGPAYAYYHADVYSQFMTFAKNNNVLPDIMIWHELDNSFFTDWNTHYNHYRGIETSLGITPRPIIINEYGRASTDIGVPGNLVQFISKFENSKVGGNIAYWTTAGGLNDLVTQNNRPTGAWWLYKWYGDMTGNTVQVTPPAQNGSLQGVATLDSSKKQARVILGGSVNSSDVFGTDVVIKGFGSAPYFGNAAHVTVWGTDNTGTNPAGVPYVVQEGDYSIVNGQIAVPVNGMKALSAYQLIITPDKDLSTVGSSTRYQAEYADISGTASITYGSTGGYSGTSFVEGYGGTNNASTNFVVNAASNGYYDVTVRYAAGPFGSAPSTRSLRMDLNGSTLTDLSLPATASWDTWNDSTIRVFLTAGINRISLKAYTNDESDAVNIDYIDVLSASGTMTTYQAEASGHTRGGAAAISSNASAAGGSVVGWIGGGTANYLQFNSINVPTAGLYRMVVTYANAEVVGTHAYNNNIVNRFADISVNGGTAQRHYFRNTLSWTTFYTTVVDVQLNAGNNTIRFSNSTAYAPDIDQISIAKARD